MNTSLVKIGPITYEIVEIDELGDKDEKWMGYAKHDQAIIELDKNLPPQSKHQILWHEILHGLIYQMGIEDHDERLIEALSFSVIQVLQDNPWLLNIETMELGMEAWINSKR
jgi:hypothetical protein